MGYLVLSRDIEGIFASLRDTCLVTYEGYLTVYFKVLYGIFGTPNTSLNSVPHAFNSHVSTDTSPCIKVQFRMHVLLKHGSSTNNTLDLVVTLETNEITID